MFSFVEPWLSSILEPQVIFMDDGQSRFVCPQCGVKYKKISGLRGHMKECGRGESQIKFILTEKL